MNDDQPTIEDWIAVGNGIRRSMNRFRSRLGMTPIPMITHADRPPTDEELAEYDAIVPGAAETLRQHARNQMMRRKEREMMRNHPINRLIRWLSGGSR